MKTLSNESFDFNHWSPEDEEAYEARITELEQQFAAQRKAVEDFYETIEWEDIMEQQNNDPAYSVWLDERQREMYEEELAEAKHHAFTPVPCPHCGDPFSPAGMCDCN